MSRFFRLSTDGFETPVELEHGCAGPFPAACWLIGGGPSLASLPCADIAQSPAPKFAINLAGHRLLRPNFWTAYDPSIRFHKSIYLDAGVVKFLPRPRAMDMVPETTFKVCECPQTYFFDRDSERGYSNFVSADTTGIVDWADSLVQAIDIAYRLGFRRLYLAGCELCVRPSRELLLRAAKVEVVHNDGEPLADFVKRCRAAGLTDDGLRSAGLSRQYHFDEEKSFDAAVRTDAHYFRIVQSLRLSRRSLSLAGLQLISVTPRSRLNAFFPYRQAETVLNELRLELGDPAREPTRGLYTQTAERPKSAALMRDMMPPQSSSSAKQPPCPCVKSRAAARHQDDPELIVEDESWQPVGRFSKQFVMPVEVFS